LVEEMAYNVKQPSGPLHGDQFAVFASPPQAPSPKPQALLAATTADDVFKSMGDSLDSDINPWHLAGIIGAMMLLVVVVALLSRRGQHRKVAKPSGNITRLNRQLAKAAGLKSREMKQLKMLAAQEQIENPLVLLLCPSVLKSAAAKRQAARAA